MSEERLKELFDYIDRRLIICNTVKEPINKDLDCAIKLSVAYENLQGENKQLKDQLKQRDEVIDEAIKYIEKNMNQKLYTGEQIFDTYSPATDLLEILQKYKGDKNE